jgi:hypothetical protein
MEVEFGIAIFDQWSKSHFCSAGHEELLRAAAWGEERTLRELLGLQLAMRQVPWIWDASFNQPEIGDLR